MRRPTSEETRTDATCKLTCYFPICGVAVWHPVIDLCNRYIVYRISFNITMLDINWLSPVDLAVVTQLRPTKNWLIDWLIDWLSSSTDHPQIHSGQTQDQSPSSSTWQQEYFIVEGINRMQQLSHQFSSKSRLHSSSLQNKCDSEDIIKPSLLY